MRRWFIERQKDNVIITIMKNKSDGTYSFVNLTNEHICPCKFDNIENALKDMDRQIEDGTIARYVEIEDVDNEI